MDKKILAILGASVLVIAILIGIKMSQPPDEIKYFTPEPVSWVEERETTEEPNDVRIGVMKATGGESVFNFNKQEFDSTAFFSFGYYHGYPFEISFIEDSISKMEIGPLLDPDDGVIQGFIMAKEDLNEYAFYIFVDEDWKSQLKFTNVVYGKDFNNPATLTEGGFDFEEVHTGIYMDTIEDSDWYKENPVTGGIMLGEITKQDLSKDNLNATFIMFR